MAGTSEGAKKAAETRKKEDPKAFQKMGSRSHRGSLAKQEKKVKSD